MNVMADPSTHPTTDATDEVAPPLLEVRGLRTEFTTKFGPMTAVNGVDLTVERGEILGVVGESGSGKSVTSRSLMRILPEEGRVIDGSVRLDGTELLDLTERQMSDVRGRRIAMVFQEASAALNPLLTVGEQIAEGVRRHRRVGRREAKARAIGLLDALGIPAPETRYKAYPHQLSGGMQQRCMIAVALAVEPDLLIADEPTTALDVTVQNQILELLADQADQRDLGLIFITHNIAAVAQIAHRVAVMYAGRVVEVGPTGDVIDDPQHPYTKALLAAMPAMRGSREVSLSEIPGRVPDLLDMPTGCPFHPRCASAHDACRSVEPEPVPVTRGGRTVEVRCLLHTPDGPARRAADPSEINPSSTGDTTTTNKENKHANPQ